jgi:2-oxoglutarate dehydrogenase E1 component
VKRLLEKDFRAELQGMLDEVKAEDKVYRYHPMFEGAWSGLHLANHTRTAYSSTDTSVSEEDMFEIGNKLTAAGRINSSSKKLKSCLKTAKW